MPAPRNVAPSLIEAATRLNKLTDQAAEKIRAAEVFLNDQCSVGIPVSVKTRTVDSEFDEYLEYARWGTKGFRILVAISNGIDEEPASRKPWLDCDRETKLATLIHLPSLLDTLTKAVLERTKQAEEALKEVDKLELDDDIPF